jgi:8-oxo-dGTP diphosphatase
MSSTTSIWTIAKAQAYGGVLLTRTGQVLLREPANHFEGYVWTFAKGTPDAGENPEQTALREVEEETGYPVEVVGVLPGAFRSAWSASAYFVMRHVDAPKQPDWETQSTRWASFKQAAQLIQATTNIKGRARDLAVLAAAQVWFEGNLSVVLPDGQRTGR